MAVRANRGSARQQRKQNRLNRVAFFTEKFDKALIDNAEIRPELEPDFLYTEIAETLERCYLQLVEEFPLERSAVQDAHKRYVESMRTAG